MTVRRFLRTHILHHFGGDRRYARFAFIAAYDFPGAVRAKFAAQTPALDDAQRDQVFDALRSYFTLCAVDPNMPAAMPSRIVDAAWHDFILSTRDYTAFCERAFGRYLHHMPGVSDDGLERTWRAACAREGIPPARPTRLPGLFAIDRQFGIPGGRYYALNETDADATRRMLGAGAIVYLAAALGGTDIWRDPIFQDAHSDGLLTPFGGDLAGGDLGLTDSGDGGGGCSGGGT